MGIATCHRTSNSPSWEPEKQGENIRVYSLGTKEIQKDEPGAKGAAYQQGVGGDAAKAQGAQTEQGGHSLELLPVFTSPSDRTELPPQTPQQVSHEMAQDGATPIMSHKQELANLTLS